MFSWANVLDLLATAPTKMIKLACLYETDGRLLLFSTDGLEACLQCQPWFRQIGKIGPLFDCKHACYESEDGRLPREIGNCELVDIEATYDPDE